MKRNKGEWSELYVLLELLKRPEISVVDSKLTALPDDHVTVTGVIRGHATEEIVKYQKVASGVKITNAKGDRIAPDVDYQMLANWSNHVLEGITRSTQEKGAKSIPGLEQCYKALKLNDGRFLQQSQFKEDIKLIVTDPLTGLQSVRGFSVKSFIGANPTLLNASGATRITFRFSDSQLKTMCGKINAIKGSSHLVRRIREIQNVVSQRSQSAYTYFYPPASHLYGNLSTIDCCLPELMADMLWHSYLADRRDMQTVAEHLCDAYVARGNDRLTRASIKYKLQALLNEVSIGMMPDTPWTGADSVSGGMLFVDKSGEILSVRTDSRGDLWEYLFNNTAFDTPSTSRSGIGELIETPTGCEICLSLHIRYTSHSARIS